jgi:hypothetical protein
LGPHHVLAVDHRAVEDFYGLGVAAAVVCGAAEEVHADAVALLQHRLSLFARRNHVAAGLVVAADGDDAAVGTCPAAGRGEDSREDSCEA